jgi:hypothetical protein
MRGPPKKLRSKAFPFATPRLRQVAVGMYMPRFNADVQRPKPRSNTMNNNVANIDSKKPTSKQELIAANI